MNIEEQSAQTTRPHFLQWCFLLKIVNFLPQPGQTLTSSSGCHTGTTSGGSGIGPPRWEGSSGSCDIVGGGGIALPGEVKWRGQQEVFEAGKRGEYDPRKSEVVMKRIFGGHRGGQVYREDSESICTLKGLS